MEIQGRSFDEVNYYILLLSEAGLIESIEIQNTQHGLTYVARRLTWDGHKFLDAVNSDTVWNKAKAHVIKSLGHLKLEGLNIALPIVTHAAIAGEKTGIGKSRITLEGSIIAPRRGAKLIPCSYQERASAPRYCHVRRR